MEKNKDLIESYKLTTVRDRIGIYGQRLILRLVEFATAEGATKGLDFKSGRDLRQVQLSEDLFYKRIEMPLSYITGDSDNRSKPRESIKALMQEVIEAEDADGDWFAFPFLSFAQVKNGMLAVEVRKELWQVFMDFRKGFRRYELQAAMQLKSTYSLRLYKLVSDQGAKELDWQLDELKKMLGVGDKYPRPRDFFVKVLNPAKEELDRVAPWSFTYTPLTSRKQAGGRAAIVGVRFFPRKQPWNRDPDLMAKEASRQHSGNNPLVKGLTLQQQQLLTKHFGFTYKGLNTPKNAAVLDAAVKNLDLTTWLMNIKPRIDEEQPKNVPGFIIGCLRKELRDMGVQV